MKRFGRIFMAAVLLAIFWAAGAWAVEPLETYTYDAAGNLTRVESWFLPGADDDGDGLNNGQELILGTALDNPDTDADDDPDFDGFSNYQEYRHSTDPWSAESYPHPASVPYLLLLDD